MLMTMTTIAGANRQLEKENHVLSEALEVVQQQADALDSDNRKLKASRSASVSGGSPLPARGQVMV
jgi:hypothetical protein